MKDWEDVPLKLETATPTYQVGLPSLSPWSLSILPPIPIIQQQPVAYPRRRTAGLAPNISMERLGAVYPAFVECNAEEDKAAPVVPPEMIVNTATVTSRGNVSATFDVPGIITIPSDGAAHNVTITKLNLEATMSWIAIPKRDARTRLSVSICPLSIPNRILMIRSGKDQECVRVYAAQRHRQRIR